MYIFNLPSSMIVRHYPNEDSFNGNFVLRGDVDEWFKSNNYEFSTTEVREFVDEPLRGYNVLHIHLELSIPDDDVAIAFKLTFGEQLGVSA